jgi:EAL domain-containing protein (putative c-di-GMP-specific phosphodiesterase class I)
MLVYAQPVIELSTGQEAWCEFLVRLREPGAEASVLEPDAFLPAAERFGLIQAIDVWMVEQALQLTPERAPEVNLSALTLSDPSARHQIVALLAAAPEAARRIVFEITETADPGYFDAAAEFAADLTTLGCGLALDDFGTGFGSFTYLRQLPLRYLKIDRSFVTGVIRSREDLRVVQSIIRIAESFGLRVIGEGVEDAATLELLRELGVDYAQGFHLGRPAPVGSASDRDL